MIFLPSGFFRKGNCNHYGSDLMHSRWVERGVEFQIKKLHDLDPGKRTLEIRQFGVEWLTSERMLRSFGDMTTPCKRIDQIAAGSFVSNFLLEWLRNEGIVVQLDFCQTPIKIVKLYVQYVP